MWLFSQKSRRIDSFIPADKLSQCYEVTFLKPGGIGKGDFGNDSLTTLDDFSIASINLAEPSIILKTDSEKLWTPYSIDINRQAMVFVECDTKAFKNIKVPFFYHAQRQLAKRALLIPYEQMIQLSKSLESVDLTGILFVNSVGRCGSNLVSKLMETIPGVQSITESDIYSNFLISSANIPQEVMIDLIRSSTIFLKKFMTCLYSEQPLKLLVIKHRSFVTNIATLFQLALPESKQMFLYRNALDTIDSFCLAFLPSTWLFNLQRYLRLDSMFVMTEHNIKNVFPVAAPLLLDSTTYNIQNIRSLGMVGLITMLWLSTMDSALKNQSCFDVFLKYEDLMINPKKEIITLLSQCHFQTLLKSNSASNNHDDGDVNMITTTTTTTSSTTVDDWNIDESKWNQVLNSDAHGEDSTTTSKKLEMRLSSQKMNNTTATTSTAIPEDITVLKDTASSSSHSPTTADNTPSSSSAAAAAATTTYLYLSPTDVDEVKNILKFHDSINSPDYTFNTTASSNNSNVNTN